MSLLAKAAACGILVMLGMVVLVLVRAYRYDQHMKEQQSCSHEIT